MSSLSISYNWCKMHAESERQCWYVGGKKIKADEVLPFLISFLLKHYTSDNL